MIGTSSYPAAMPEVRRYRSSSLIRNRRSLFGLVIYISGSLGLATALAPLSRTADEPWRLAVAGLALVALVAGLHLITTGMRRARAAARAEWTKAAGEAVARIEETLPPPAPKLEDEISEVSGMLTTTVGRLRDISSRAQAFEAEVQDLVKRADAAQAAADLSEEQASKIALLLSEQSRRDLLDQVDKLTAAHDQQIERLSRSSTRMAIITFVGGVLLGALANILVAALMN